MDEISKYLDSFPPWSCTVEVGHLLNYTPGCLMSRRTSSGASKSWPAVQRLPSSSRFGMLTCKSRFVFPRAVETDLAKKSAKGKLASLNQK